jgi:Low iron-inducible periplasmic protein
MKSCATCEYHSDFQKFVDYYGDTDYADKWIKAASYELSTEFSSGRGNANFTGLQKIGVAEAMLAGTVYLNLFMHVIHEVEMAAAACDGACQPGLTCVEEPVHALDRAVAFYCGSLEGEHGSGEGVFQFAIANHRGKDFRTAGETRNKTSGEANANQDLISQFNRAKLSLNRKNCDAVLQHRIDIINLLKVPVIQALLRMAYIRDFEDLSDDLLDKAEGAGATFAAAILPFVHACNAADAEIVYQNMKIGATDSQVSFSSVKSALERNYECMGVTCTDIGGLWEEDKYADGAEPCTHIVSSDSSPSVAANSDKATDARGDQGKSAGGKAATWIMVLTVLGLMAGFVAYRRVVVRKRRNIEKNFRASSSNIAAVSEIA